MYLNPTFHVFRPRDGRAVLNGFKRSRTDECHRASKARDAPLQAETMIPHRQKKLPHREQKKYVEYELPGTNYRHKSPIIVNREQLLTMRHTIRHQLHVAKIHASPDKRPLTAV